METVVDGKLVHYQMVHPKGAQDVLILHGWGHDSAMWLPVMEQLPGSWRVFVPDLPGFGRSRSLDEGAGMLEYGNWVRSLIITLKLKKPLLVGHSLGGQIATYIAGEMKIPMGKLVLLAPAIVRQGKSRWLSYRNWLVRFLSPLKVWLPRGWRSRLTDFFDYSLASITQKQVFKAIISMDMRGYLPLISEPTMIVWGEKDKEILGDAKKLANLLPRGRLRVIYNAGHNFPFEKTSELVRIMRHFASL